VVEAEEEEADGVSRRLREMHLTAPSPVEEEPEVAEVPVVVEQSVMGDAKSLSQDSPAGEDDEDDSEEDSDDANDADEADQTVVGSASEPDPMSDEDTQSNEPESTPDSLEPRESPKKSVTEDGSTEENSSASPDSTAEVTPDTHVSDTDESKSGIKSNVSEDEKAVETTLEDESQKNEKQ
jgi:hypothetical protein